MSPAKALGRLLSGGDPIDCYPSSRSVLLPINPVCTFRLPNAGLQHMTMINTPMFFAAMPRTFLDKMRALRPDPATGKPSPEALAAFGASHPDNRGQAKFLADHNPPASYATSAYFGIHTFKFIDRAHKVTLVRWRFVPEDGEKALTDQDLKSMPRDFLEQALIDRTRQGPARWTMLVIFGEAGAPENDPTLAWPQNRKEVKVGTLTISSAMTQKGAGCENINFDPLVMGDGIEPTDDPVLLFRSPSYVRSYIKRLQGL